MNITIDCSAIGSRDALHRIFSDALHFPVWYGNNLDALHDCLSTLTGTVRLENWAAAEAALGKYGLAARRVLTDAAIKNTQLDLIF